MKNLRLIIIVLFALAPLGYLGAANGKKAAAESYKTKQFSAAIFPASYKNAPPSANKGRFTPSHANVDSAEVALRTKLNVISQDYTIAKDLDHYYRQYLGYMDDKGHHYITIGFVWMDKVSSKKYLNNFIVLKDGGDKQWQVKFDVETNSLFELAVNAKQ
jgi:hypothetical protein